MTQDELDRILAGDATLEPSSGFADAVHERIREGAVPHVPPAFPWRRYLVGLALLVAAATWCAVAVSRAVGPMSSDAAMRAASVMLRSPLAVPLALGAAALCGSLVLLTLTLRFMRRT